MTVTLLVLLAQTTAKEPPKARQAYEAAKYRASRWDSDAACYAFGMRPKSDVEYESGRGATWNFLFCSRRGCEPGRVRTATIEVWYVTQASPAKEIAHGYGIGFVDRGESEPPLPMAIEEGWLDSDRAFSALRKAGLGPGSGDVRGLEVRWIHGRTLWKGMGVTQVLHVDAQGRVVARGDPLDPEIFLPNLRTTSLTDAAARVSRDWGLWREAGPIRVVGMDAVSLDAAAFLNGARVSRATFQVVVEKPAKRRLAARVLADRVEWLSSDPKAEGTEPLALDKLAGFRDALAANAGLKAWTEKNPKAVVRLQSVKGGKLLLTFKGTEEKVSVFDPATGKID